MRDVQLNGLPLLVEGKSTEFGLILRRQGVTMGCHSSACSSQPCYSPFLCVDLWRKYECRYLKLLFSPRGGWEVLSFPGNVLLTLKIPVLLARERHPNGKYCSPSHLPAWAKLGFSCKSDMDPIYPTIFSHGKKITGQ